MRVLQVQEQSVAVEQPQGVQPDLVSHFCFMNELVQPRHGLKLSKPYLIYTDELSRDPQIVFII